MDNDCGIWLFPWLYKYPAVFQTLENGVAVVIFIGYPGIKIIIKIIALSDYAAIKIIALSDYAAIKSLLRS